MLNYLIRRLAWHLVRTLLQMVALRRRRREIVARMVPRRAR